MTSAPFFSRIDIRHARLVLLLAVTLGAATALTQVYLDYRAQRVALPAATGKLVDASVAAAEQAAWQMDSALAERIAAGLLEYGPIRHVRISTDFGATLVDIERPADPSMIDGLASFLFSEGAAFERPLYADGSPMRTGVLFVAIEPRAAAASFLNRAATAIIGAIIKNLVFAAGLLAVFHWTLAKPIRGIVDDVAAIDPAQPAAARIKPPKSARQGELAFLVERVNAMLVAIDRSQEERLRAEAERRSAELQLTAAADAIAEGVLLFDGEGVLLLFNQRVLDDHPGLTSVLTPGLTLDEFIDHMAERGGVAAGVDDRAAWRGACRNVFAAPGASMEWPLLDGRWVRATLHRASDGGSIIITSDITRLKTAALELEARVSERTQALTDANAALREEVAERRAAERAAAAARRDADQANADLLRTNAELDRASLAKSEFLARVSHELRTPLNAVIGYSEFILLQAEQARDPAKTDEYVNNILVSGRHLLSLVNDVRDLSKIEADEFILSEIDIDVRPAVESVIAMLAPDAAAKHVALETHYEDAAAVLRADDRAFRQIILNLLSNALKFTPEGGSVTLSTDWAAAGGVRITVADTGVGIAPHDHARVFEPFQQAERAAAASGQPGTGLGLPITKSLIELHGGTITLDSALGEGCRVDVVFPAERTAGAASSDQ